MWSELHRPVSALSGNGRLSIIVFRLFGPFHFFPIESIHRTVSSSRPSLLQGQDCTFDNERGTINAAPSGSRSAVVGLDSSADGELVSLSRTRKLAVSSECQ